MSPATGQAVARAPATGLPSGSTTRPLRGTRVSFELDGERLRGVRDVDDLVGVIA